MKQFTHDKIPLTLYIRCLKREQQSHMLKKIITDIWAL